MADEKLTYAILGTGAVGGLYGSFLARSGCRVHFLARSDYAHIRQHGLQVESPWGDFHLPQVHCYSSTMDMPEVDVVIVAWKTTDNAHLAEALEPLCGAETAVLVLQNGWDVERDAAECVGSERVLGGCCFLCCHKAGPGHIRHLDYGRIVFGEYADQARGKLTPRMRAIARDFSDAGIDIEPSVDLRDARWRKLMWNIPYNGLSVVLNADTQQLMHDPASALLVASLMLEVRQAAEHHGCRIEEEYVDKLLEDTRRMVPYDSSMRLDYRHRRPIEVEAIVGNPLRAAQHTGYHPRQMEMLYHQLCFLDRHNRKAAAVADLETVAQDPDQSHHHQQKDGQQQVS